MFARAHNLRAVACRPLSRLAVCALALLVLSAGLSNRAHAAGCAHRTENVQTSVDPFGKPLAANVVKIYSGGEFKYYVLPTGKSCNGPSCESAPPSHMNSVPAVVHSDRTDLSFLSNCLPIGYSHYCDRFVSWPAPWPASVELDGLLRPPTA